MVFIDQIEWFLYIQSSTIGTLASLLDPLYRGAQGLVRGQSPLQSPARFTGLSSHDKSRFVRGSVAECGQ